ncbi:MAG: DEAD/DEAH box helicase, partial [Micrococcales bacterium]|nr:DEAD/DEAH box helicase [Micrococcales bacterium]
MDASLSFELIAGALGPDPSLQGAYSDGVLPTPERLQELLAQAEVQLFIGQGGVEQLLLQTGWFLHGVASADESLGLYEVAQQRQAFAVSAHIFDLACQDEEADELLRLQWAFAAQVGFHRSEAEPNAGAIGRRVDKWASIVGADIDLTERLPSLALRAGIALLTLDAGAAARRLTAWNRELLTFEAQLGTNDAGATVFGPTLLVVHACYDLLRYLREGNPDRLATAQNSLSRAVSAEHEGHDHIARWVASHIRSIGDAVARGSVWTVLPPSVPDAAKQAFTMTSPHVLTLWQPQRELLAPSVDPGRGHAAKRLIVSVPTSAGKTLIGQLLMVEHLATRGTGVCYIAPQRSLGREVRRGLMRRLRLLARELARQAPDAGLPAGGALADLLRSVGLSADEILSALDGSETYESDIAIMTPERLSHALREDPEAVLSRYGMFVFDEAHQIRERGRGFLLESVISYLHWRSRDTEHRIVLLSAVLGNAGQIRSWLDPGEQGRLLESSWRGPRRLSVLFGVSEDKQALPTIEPVAARGSMAAYTQRRKRPVHGVFRLKPTGREVVGLKTRAALGQVSYRTTPAGLSWPTAEGSPHSTPKYRMLAQLVSFLGRAGSVLVVCDERKSARNMAQAIAETLPPHEQGRALALTARIKLGEDHPLPATLEHGVAYHHAGLPSDLLESIEDAVRQGELNYLVSTSTLTEGVNLPVRTVVLSPAYYPDQPEDQKMTGPRLVNAVGRAWTS